MALVINKDGEVIVRSPDWLSEKKIAEFVNNKESWILEKQELVLKKRELTAFDLSISIPFLGQVYKIQERTVRDIMIEGDSLILPLSASKDYIIKWMKAEAKQLIFKRTEYYARVIGVSYSSVKLSNARTRWGSCSSKNSLNFSWRLIMCSPSAIDYIVIHELCHIKNKNHGIGFFAQVKSVMPDYLVQEAFLKQNSGFMDLF
ncbi:MAG: SprT family zinc-dependent metalloprotease [Clostridia bacterium]